MPIDDFFTFIQHRGGVIDVLILASLINICIIFETLILSMLLYELKYIAPISSFATLGV